jgi:hypothetical protein
MSNPNITTCSNLSVSADISAGGNLTVQNVICDDISATGNLQCATINSSTTAANLTALDVTTSIQAKFNAIDSAVALKPNISSVVLLTTNQSISGIKTFSQAPVLPNNSISNAMINNACINGGFCDATSSIQTQLNSTVKLSGNQTVGGIKSFSQAPVLPNNSISNAMINNACINSGFCDATSSIQNQIGTEITNRTDADTAIQNQVTALQQTSIVGYGGIRQPQSGGAIAIVNSQVSSPLLDFALYQGSSGDTVLNTAAGQALEFKQHNVEHMRITSGGNVAIKKTTADYALDVNGQINGNQIFSNGLEMIPTAICAKISSPGSVTEGGGITVAHPSAGYYVIKIDTGIKPKVRGFPWLSGQGYSMRISPISDNVANMQSFYPDYDYFVQIQGGGSSPVYNDAQFWFYLI